MRCRTHVIWPTTLHLHLFCLHLVISKLYWLYKLFHIKATADLKKHFLLWLTVRLCFGRNPKMELMLEKLDKSKDKASIFISINNLFSLDRVATISLITWIQTPSQVDDQLHQEQELPER